jgi:hypothetical protein
LRGFFISVQQAKLVWTCEGEMKNNNPAKPDWVFYLQERARSGSHPDSYRECNPDNPTPIAIRTKFQACSGIRRRNEKQQSGKAGLGFLFAGAGMVWITAAAVIR